MGAPDTTGAEPGSGGTELHDHPLNAGRFCVTNRQIAWVALFAVILWGIYGYMQMPKRKDPEIPVRVAVAICPWPGISAEKVEQLVTRKIEQAAAGNSKLERLTSTSRDSVSVVFVRLDESVEDTQAQFQDIGQRLNQIRDLPQGAGPIQWISDFGDTAALMLTVASPEVPALELELRARGVQQELERVRAGSEVAGRTSILYCYPSNVSPALVERPFAMFVARAEQEGVLRDARPFSGAGCSGVDVASLVDDAQLLAFGQKFLREKLNVYDIHPDAWGPILLHSPAEAREKLTAAAGGRYSYRELDDYTDLIQRTLQRVPLVSKVQRSGVLPEEISLNYSQERLAAYDLQPSKLASILNARNSTTPGGVLNTADRSVLVDPNSDFHSASELDGVLVSTSNNGAPVYLRELVDVERGYQSPARYLNYLTWHDAQGQWHRSRAVTLAVQMRSGAQIAEFGKQVDAALGDLKPQLPGDLLLARTSDQPRQVKENVNLFMISLYEAIVLVVVVALVGFWDWRAAALIATSIPLTLAITFGAVRLLNVDIQQVSIATLIIALGLLVDMPVVAGDAIKREMGQHAPREIAAWLGPTKLARAILFATITNIVAYLPFLLLTGSTGRFLKTLPIVMTSTLLAALVVSLTFIPLIAYYLINHPDKPELPIAERREHGFAGYYYMVGDFALKHRWPVILATLPLLVLGAATLKHLKPEFFPKDLSYLSYVDIWLPSDAPLGATDVVARKAENVIRAEAERYGREHKHNQVLQSLTTFAGGGGPRFWFSVEPEQQQLNYAQIIVEVTDKHFTNELVGPLQTALSREIPGARIDIRQLETGKPVGIPVSIRISGGEIATLRELSSQLQSILRATPGAARSRDDWGEPAFTLRVKADADRANLSGVSNMDVALSSAAGLSGLAVSTMREGDKQIPIVARLRMEERAALEDVQNLYVYSLSSLQRVPLRQLSQVSAQMEVQKIMRRNQFRTITVGAFPEPGILPSEVLAGAMPKIEEFRRKMPPGYWMEIGGEYEEQQKGFKELGMVMAVSVFLIYIALVVQFRSAIKPLIVFAAIPYGMVGAVCSLALMHQPFGFMAFLGVASLVGVIVSHIIVLFDFIEEARERGENLRDGLLDAGIVRLRPVLITVAATVLGLFPLALHGGPLWEPLCYAQIGGLTIATFVTLLLVPVIYSIFVLDLKWIRWESPKEQR